MRIDVVLKYFTIHYCKQYLLIKYELFTSVGQGETIYAASIGRVQ